MARNLLQMDVDVSGASKKLFKLERKIDDGAKLTAKEFGELGKYYARSIAPYWSGKTFRNITLRRGQKGTDAIIVARNPTPGRKDKFNLVRWMHQKNGVLHGKKHIRSGEPQFMYRTRDYLEKQVPSRVTARYNKIVADINK